MPMPFLYYLLIVWNGDDDVVIVSFAS